MIHNANCRRRDCSCSLPSRPLPYELRRFRELAYEAGVPVPAGLGSWTRPQVRVGIARLVPLAQEARRRGVAV